MHCDEIILVFTAECVSITTVFACTVVMHCEVIIYLYIFQLTSLRVVMVCPLNKPRQPSVVTIFFIQSSGLVYVLELISVEEEEAAVDSDFVAAPQLSVWICMRVFTNSMGDAMKDWEKPAPAPQITCDLQLYIGFMGIIYKNIFLMYSTHLHRKMEHKSPTQIG